MGNGKKANSFRLPFRLLKNSQVRILQRLNQCTRQATASFDCLQICSTRSYSSIFQFYKFSILQSFNLFFPTKSWKEVHLVIAYVANIILDIFCNVINVLWLLWFEKIFVVVINSTEKIFSRRFAENIIQCFWFRPKNWAPDLDGDI